MSPGKIRLVPSDSDLPDWKNDYAAMRRVFFFGTVPAFDELIQAVTDFQTHLNTKEL